MIDMGRKLLREPIVHFLAAALLIFLVHRALAPASLRPADRIEVGAAKVEQLSGLFAKTWQRPPTAAELKGLIDDYVKEEIAYREALALGLDRDDTVIRRRLRQKLEFMASADTGPQPTEAELQAYLDAHPDRYAVEPLVSFRQVYFDPQRRAATIDADIASALEVLRADPASRDIAVGDATMLPASADLVSVGAIARDFGQDFASALAKADVGRWSGPIASSFGMHLVWVGDRQPGGRASLDQARAAVLRDLSEERRKAREEQWYAERLKTYSIEIVLPHGGGAADAQ